MAKKKARPEFNLPSTEPMAPAAGSPEWVYRSEADHADPGPVPEADLFGGPVTTLGKAQQIVSSYSRFSALAGLIPMPTIDMIAVGGLQMKMLSALAAHYGVAFNDNRSKSLVAALIGSVGSTNIAYGVGGSLLKSIPVVGSIAGVFAMPGFAFALTYAIGKVFILHFESGGTLLDFDPVKMRAHFASEFAAAGSAPITKNAGRATRAARHP